jgi:hypothetical protein
MKSESLIVYMTPDEKEILAVEKSALPSGDTPEVIRFTDLAIKVKSLGYAGVNMEAIRLKSGGFFIAWQFDASTIEGQELQAIANKAIEGVMPPTDDQFICLLKIKYWSKQ